MDLSSRNAIHRWRSGSALAHPESLRSRYTCRTDSPCPSRNPRWRSGRGSNSGGAVRPRSHNAGFAVTRARSRSSAAGRPRCTRGRRRRGRRTAPTGGAAPPSPHVDVEVHRSRPGDAAGAGRRQCPFRDQVAAALGALHARGSCRRRPRPAPYTFDPSSRGADGDPAGGSGPPSLARYRHPVRADCWSGGRTPASRPPSRCRRPW